MGKRTLALLLCSAVAVSGLTGCGHKTEITGQPADTAINTGQTEAAESGTVEATEEPPTEESLFDADKALENTYLCGVQLAPGMTLGMLGEDFTVEPEGAVSSPGSDKLLCDVDYKGEYIGQFIFQGCNSPEDITSSTIIRQIKVDVDDIEGYEGPVISVYGLTPGDSHEELYAAMGSGYETGVNDSQIMYKENGIMRYHFGFRAPDDTDRLALIIIYFP